MDDFKMRKAICELRYQDAYLLFDRSGRIFHDLRERFSKLEPLEIAPNKLLFKSDVGTLLLELGQCRVDTDAPDGGLEKFAEHVGRFLDTVASNLDLKVFTRIGLRIIFLRKQASLNEARDALDALKLLALEKSVRFGASDRPTEIIVRWEGSQIGTTLRLKAETGTIDAVLPPELEVKETTVHRELHNLVLDVDYYTAAPVERGQWDAKTWIPQGLRIVKKGAAQVMGE